MGVALLVLETDLDRGLADVRAELDLEAPHLLAQVQRVALVQVEVDVDRVELLDGREHRGPAGAHEVARVHLPRAEPALERRPDLRVSEVDLRELELRLGLIPLADPALDGRLRRRVLLHHRLLAVELQLRADESGLVQLDLRLVGRLLDDEEEVPLRHHGAVLEVDRLEISGHPRHEIDRLRGGHRSRQLQVLDDRFLPRCLDRHRRRRRRARLRLLAAAGRRRAERGAGERNGDPSDPQRFSAPPVHGSSSGDTFGTCCAVSSNLPQFVRRAISALTSSERTSPPSRISQPPPSAR